MILGKAIKKHPRPGPAGRAKQLFNTRKTDLTPEPAQEVRRHRTEVGKGVVLGGREEVRKLG